MSLDHRMDEENQSDLYIPLINFLKVNQMNRVSNDWNLINIIVATCYVKSDFDLIMFINQHRTIIIKCFGTIDNFINKLRDVAGQQYRVIAGISVPLDRLRNELNRINRVLAYYNETDINSILSDYSQRFGGKKPQFDGSDIQSQSDSLIITSQDNAQLRSQLQDLRARYAALATKCEQNDALLNELRGSWNQRTDKEQLSEQIENCKKNQKEMKDQSMSLLSHIEKLESAMRKNEETRHQHEEKYIRMEEENTDLRDKNEELQKRIAEIEEEKKILQEKYKSGEISAEEANKISKNLQDKIARIEKENAALKREVPMLQRQFETRDRELREQYDMKYDKINEQYRSDLQMYRDDSQLWQTNWQDVNTRNQNLVAQNQDLYGRLADARQARGTFEGKLEGMKPFVSHLEESYRNKDTQFENLQQDYSQLQYSAGQLEGRIEGLKENRKYIIDTTNRILESKDKEINWLKGHAQDLQLQLEKTRQVVAQLQYTNQNLLTANQTLLIEGNAIIQNKDKVIQEKESLEIVDNEKRKRVYEEVKEQGIKEGKEQGIKEGMERMRQQYSKFWDELNTKEQQLLEDKNQLLIKYDTLKKEKEDQDKQMILVQKQLEVKAQTKDVDKNVNNEDDRIKSYILWSIQPQYLIKDFLDTKLEKYTLEEFEDKKRRFGEYKGKYEVFEKNRDNGHAIILLVSGKDKGLFYKYYNQETSKYVYVNMNPLIIGRTAADTLIRSITGETHPMIQDIPRERKHNETGVLDIDIAEPISLAEPILLSAPKHKDESDN